MSSFVNTEILEKSVPEKPKAVDRSSRRSNATARSIEPSSYLKAVRIVHRVAAFALIIPAVPIIAIAMLLIRLTSPGPAIYKQTRVGLGGLHFQLLKLRTMTLDAEAHTGPVWTAIKDPRITTFGRFLRKLHLDELPQLWNVLRGEMALIGPRPERPEFVAKLTVAIPDYTERLAALPGVTGLSQITFPPDLTIDCVRRKLIEDIRYIETANAFLDCRILLCTAFRAAGLPGGIAARLTGFRQFPSVSAVTSQCESVPGVRLSSVGSIYPKKHSRKSTNRKPR